MHERVPRNAPALFNLGAREFRRLFHDGRIQPNGAMPSGMESPAGFELPEGLDNSLAAQAMFPVISSTEMAGQAGENGIASAAAASELPPEHLKDREIAQLLDFLNALTDLAMIDMRSDVPKFVPSGMPVAD